MMKTTSLSLAIALAATVAGCAVPERSRSLSDPAITARTIAQQVCSDCHGMDGNSVSPNFPRLAAQTEVYLAAQLTEFRSHNRSDPAGFEYMWGLSKHLSDDQIKGLAAYYAVQAPAANEPGDAKVVGTGREIFEKGVPAKSIPPCMTCHGDKAQGNLQFPRLAGQHADYIEKQLGVFQKTDERPEGSIMKTIAHDLTPADITAVAEYVQGMPAR
jgi:cytochrome c553